MVQIDNLEQMGSPEQIDRPYRILIIETAILLIVQGICLYELILWLTTIQLEMIYPIMNMGVILGLEIIAYLHFVVGGILCIWALKTTKKIGWGIKFLSVPICILIPLGPLCAYLIHQPRPARIFWFLIKYSLFFSLPIGIGLFILPWVLEPKLVSLIYPIIQLWYIPLLQTLGGFLLFVSVSDIGVLIYQKKQLMKEKGMNTTQTGTAPSKRTAILRNMWLIWHLPVLPMGFIFGVLGISLLRTNDRDIIL